MGNSTKRKAFALVNFIVLVAVFLCYKGGFFDGNKTRVKPPHTHSTSTSVVETNNNFPTPQNNSNNLNHLPSSKSLILVDTRQKTESPFKPKIVQKSE